MPIKRFTCTSDKPYDRHTYQIVHDHGKSPVFDDFDVMRAYWFHHYKLWYNPTVVIDDIKPKKQKQRGKGF